MDIRLLSSSSFATVALFALFVQYGGGLEASSLGQTREQAPAKPVIALTSNLIHAASSATIAGIDTIDVYPTGADLTGLEPTGVDPTGLEPTGVDPTGIAAIGKDLEVDSGAEQIVIAPEQALPTPAHVKPLASFTVPAITGFLRPSGFMRPGWQSLSADPVLVEPDSDEERFVVMLDPGHGGTDPGSAAHNGLLEKDLTLDIARRARLFLSEVDNIDVLLTREHDHGLSRQSRVKAIRRTGADMVISLHFNHLPQKEITLVETYYAGPDNIAASLASQRRHSANHDAGALTRTRSRAAPDFSFTRGSERLARTLQQRVYAEVSHENPAADDAGVKQETMFVLTRSFTPGVLIEMTCLSNVNEADKLMTDAYRNRLAAALVDGIRSYRDSLRRSPLDTPTDIGT